VEIRGEGFTGIEFPRTSPPDDATVVQLGDAPLSEARVRDLFEQAGLPIHLELWPVGPSLVGRPLSVRSAALPDRAVLWEDGRVAVSRSWSGTLVVSLGRAASEGERYGPWSDATGPGEPFEHENILGCTLVDVRPLLAPYEVTILAGEPPRTPVRPMPLPEAGGPFDSQMIAFVQATSRTSLFLTLHPA
jgi:hypothetical protein